jgi:hypothetical protein
MLEKTSYGVRQPSGQIGNRVQKAKEYILKYWDDPRAQKIPMFEPSVVGIYGSPGHEYVSFSDGRHRVLAAEELGITEVAIEIPRNQEKKFEFMKVKSMNEAPDYKLNETPDNIKNGVLHDYTWKEKELRKSDSGKGWGSDKNRPLAWKQALYQEKIITKFSDFENNK